MRGREGKAGIGSVGLVGGDPDAPRRLEGKLNNSKVHSLKRLFRRISTLAFGLALPAGAARLYVCLRQCERVKVCVFLWRVSILPPRFFAAKQDVGARQNIEEYRARRRAEKKGGKKNKQVVKGWKGNVIVSKCESSRQTPRPPLPFSSPSFCPAGCVKWPWIAAPSPRSITWINRHS